MADATDCVVDLQIRARRGRQRDRQELLLQAGRAIPFNAETPCALEDPDVPEDAVELVPATEL